MGPDNRKKVRFEVEQGNWTIIWVGAEMPCAFLNEEVELLYEDMDGEPCICEAIYTLEPHPTLYIPFFQRKSDGVRMGNCIAWRKRK